ncbi:MAG: DNA adenine methylase [Candidatus Berkiella sp.]
MAIITPFRYPGSKNKLLPVLMEYINKFLKDAYPFCDAFVGGGSVALEVASKYPKSRIYMNDKDYWIYSFWDIVAGSETDKLPDLLKLIDEPVTLELFYKLRAEDTKDKLRCAYKAIFFNRTTFSGIFKSGPIGGKEQKSQYTVDCRYNADKIKKKILQCNKLLAGRAVVTNKDILDCLAMHDDLTTLYLDPPYYVKGQALYSEFMVAEEHNKMQTVLSARTNWVLSYDDCPEVRSLYSKYQIIDLSARYCINGKKDTWEHKNELIITP